MIRMPVVPFTPSGRTDQRDAVSTRITASLNPAVPVGKLFVVEHVSGWVGVGEGDIVDSIHAEGSQNAQMVYLPRHFGSRLLNFGGHLGVARRHQFGSPCRLYVAAGNHITVSVDANTAGVLEASAIGYLVDA